MPQSHLVSFYRRVVDERHSHLTRVDQIEIPITGSDIAAAAAAIAEFERKHDVGDWRELADRYRVKAA